MHPADHLDSTYICLTNPENRQKTGRTESPEPNADERPMEEVRKGSEVVRTPRTGGREQGRRGSLPSRAPESGLQKPRGQKECVSNSKWDLTSRRL